MDDLDRIKADFYHETLTGEQENWEAIAAKVALVVRSQIDAADRVVTKGTSDSIIEGMVQTILDPFNAYGQPSEEGHIFSILPPLGIASPASSSGSPHHPATGLARSRLSSAPMNNSNTESSPATTARWAQDQKQRMVKGGDEDHDVTPRRERKDQLSWISENDEQKDLERTGLARHLTGEGPSEEETSPRIPPMTDNGW